MKVSSIAVNSAWGVCLVAAALACAIPGVGPATQAPTNTSPAPTATPFSLSDIDLGNLVILDADLAEDCVASGAEPIPDGDVPELVLAVNSIYREIDCVSDTRGGDVAVYLFDELSQGRAAYEALHGEMFQPQDAPAVGDEAASSSHTIQLLLEPITIFGGEAIFRRCQSVVVVHMWSTRSDLPILNYARGLDARVAEVSCP